MNHYDILFRIILPMFCGFYFSQHGWPLWAVICTTIAITALHSLAEEVLEKK
jgi:hypothetical protein